jgi:L-arabinose isomerase
MSTALSVDVFTDLADIVGLEALVIDDGTTIGQFRQQVRWNQAYYPLAQGL